MRWGLAGLLAAGGVITGLCLGWSELLMPPGGVAGDSNWQMRELAFLKAAYDRLQQDNARSHDSSMSLREEQARVLRQIAETAKLLPVEAVPAELRALLGDDAGSVPASLSQLIESIETGGQLADSEAAEARVPENAAPDLRIGLRLGPGGGPLPVMRTAEFATDPELREPIEPQPETAQAPRRKPRDEAAGSHR